MSYKNPNPEEKQRIIDDVVKHKLKPEFREFVAKDELTVLFHKMEECVKRVHVAAKPIIEAVQKTGGFTPFARKNMKTTLHKLFCDEFKNLDKDELIFMLALMHAESLGENLA